MTHSLNSSRISHTTQIGNFPTRSSLSSTNNVLFCSIIMQKKTTSSSSVISARLFSLNRNGRWAGYKIDHAIQMRHQWSAYREEFHESHASGNEVLLLNCLPHNCLTDSVTKCLTVSNQKLIQRRKKLRELSGRTCVLWLAKRRLISFYLECLE